MKKKIYYFIICLLLNFVVLNVEASNLTITGPESIYENENMVVTIGINTDRTAYGVDIPLTYDSTKLELINSENLVNTSGFNLEIGSHIVMDSDCLSTVACKSGAQNILKLTFKRRAAFTTGSTTISVGLIGNAYYSTNAYDYILTGASLNVSAMASRPTYNVSFNSDGGTAVTSQTITSGAKATAPTSNPTKTGYTFKNWTLNNNVYDFDTAVTGNIELKATWTANEYDVTFNYGEATGGNSSATKKVTFNSSYGDLPIPTKTNYTFGGWYKENTFTNSVIASSEVKTASNHTLYAKWIPVIKTKFTVIFMDGDITLSEIEVEENSPVSKPADPIKEGYTFKEWQSNGTAYIFNNPVTKNTILKASWTAKQYVITYKYNGATGGNASATKNITYNSAYGTLPIPTKTGYTFAGWYTSTTGETKVTEASTVTKTQNHDLYARWEQIYKITLNNDGATKAGTTAVDVSKGSNIPSITIPTKTNYYFAGYFSEENGKGTQYISAEGKGVKNFR